MVIESVDEDLGGTVGVKIAFEDALCVAEHQQLFGVVPGVVAGPQEELDVAYIRGGSRRGALQGEDNQSEGG